MGIELMSEAWEASNKNLKTLELAALSAGAGTDSDGTCRQI
jgi:hypothetical protein